MVTDREVGKFEKILYKMTNDLDNNFRILNKFFDKDIYPIENINSSNYNKVCSDTSVCHIFEKNIEIKRVNVN